MKKLLLVLLALVFTLSLAACDGEEEQQEYDYTTHTLQVYFVPSRPADEILTITAPLEQMLLDELSEAGYDLAGVEIHVSSSYEAAGVAMLSGSADIAFLPGGTYVMYADVPNSPVAVILSASRFGLSKDSSDAIDWNDGLATTDSTEYVNFYKGLIIAGTSTAARTVADKVNAGTELVWDDVKDLNWCVRSVSSSSGYIYPNLWLDQNFDKTFTDFADGKVTVTASYGATMANLANGTCDVGTIYADARKDYADDWATYGGTGTIWADTDVIGVTENIMNDTISVSKIYLTDDIIEAIQNAFLNIAQTTEGLAVMAVYSHTGYVVAEDSDYDSARALLEFMGY